MKLLLPAIAILAFLFASLIARADGSIASGQNTAKPYCPDFTALPHFSPDLKPGTLAWAFPFEEHAGQFSTGKLKDKIDARKFAKYTPKNPQKFPKSLYEFLCKHNIISPGIAGPVPPNEQSYRGTDPLLWVEDRTHGSTGVSMEIVDRLGKDALTKPMYENNDKHGKPLNFILVRVMGDWSAMKFAAFAKKMYDKQHVYLFNFVHTVGDETRIVPIHFTDLPDIPYHTVNNPFRGVISLGQELDLISRNSSDFFQFKLAAQLVLDNVVTWSEIKEDPEKAAKKAGKYFARHPTYVTGMSAAYRKLLGQSCGAILEN